ncbi:hypothetical protein RHMOL_RhmolMtG0011800 (mitochondrion) [Rhododendron molle]|nr:hypothetical protein RHMOL_RhmolMtG0011800 [Rhododendron molle]
MALMDPFSRIGKNEIDSFGGKKGITIIVNHAEKKGSDIDIHKKNHRQASASLSLIICQAPSPPKKKSILRPPKTFGLNCNSDSFNGTGNKEIQSSPARLPSLKMRTRRVNSEIELKTSLRSCLPNNMIRRGVTEQEEEVAEELNWDEG